MNSHSLLQTLLVDGKLDGYVREIGVNILVGSGRNSGVVLGILVALSDGTDSKMKDERAA